MDYDRYEHFALFRSYARFFETAENELEKQRFVQLLVPGSYVISLVTPSAIRAPCHITP